MPMQPHLQLGQQGEQEARRFLCRQGLSVLASNWRPKRQKGGLEIDIIAVDGEYLVFIEVKTRSIQGKSYRFSPLAAFSAQKQKKMLQAVQEYLTETGSWHRPCRIDLLYMETAGEGRFNVEHYTNVVDFGNIVDRGHASWQPW